MVSKVLVVAFVVGLSAGCASVPMESKESSEQAKLFGAPPVGQAGVYIYRSGSFGSALKKDVWVDGKCVGESAPNTFFFTQVAGNAEHTISTESEFSPNDLTVTMESNKNYFVQQYIKMGLTVGGANVKLVPEQEGMEAVRKLDLAKGGTCSSAR